MIESTTATDDEPLSLYEKSKEDLEKVKLIQEIRNLSLNEDKAQLEIKDLKRGFFRRTNAPALIGMIGTIFVVSVAGYTAKLGIDKLKLQDYETENNKLRTEKKDLEKSTGDLRRETDSLGKQKEKAETNLAQLGQKTSALEQGNSLLESAISLKQGENENLRDEKERLLSSIQAQKVGSMSHYIDTSLIQGSGTPLTKTVSDVVDYYEADERMQLEFRKLLRDRFAKSTTAFRNSSKWERSKPEYERAVLALILLRVTREPNWREELESIAADYLRGDGVSNVREIYTNGIPWLLDGERASFARLFHKYTEQQLSRFERSGADPNMNSSAGLRVLAVAQKGLTVSYALGDKDKDLAIRYLQDVRSKALAGDLEYISEIGEIAPSAKLVYLARVIAGNSGRADRDKLIEEIDELLHFGGGGLADLVDGYSATAIGTPANLRLLETTDWNQWLRDNNELVEIWVTDPKLEKLRSSDALFNKLLRFR